jgi:threonyl-tRNA synthetase
MRTGTHFLTVQASGFTHERFIGFLIEHYAGNFPLWLAPERVRVLALNDEDLLVTYAKDMKLVQLPGR